VSADGQQAKYLTAVSAIYENLRTVCPALSGAGPWSLDAWLFGRRSNNPAMDINRAARIPMGG